MNPAGGYVTVRVGDISPSKLRKALDGNAIRLTNEDLSGDRVMVVHKLNAKAIEKAKKAGKGLTTHFSLGEAAEDMKYHERAGGRLHGGSLWGWLKNKAFPWVKKNWNLIQPIVSQVVDAAVPALATYAGQPQLAVPAREAIRQVSGVGMKERMARVRAAKKGGSFRMP
jgi:hypothetical protein